MQRLNRALRFIDLNFRMAQKYEALQKPWMHLSLGGGLLTLLVLLPLGILIRWLGAWPIVWVLIGLIVLVYLWGLLVLGEITSLRTAQIFADLIQDDPHTAFDDASMAVYGAYAFDMLKYVLAAPGLSLLIRFQELFGDVSQARSGWKRAHPLIPPILALEDVDLRDAIEKIKGMIADNLLRFQPGYIPVARVSRVVGSGSILIGLIAGAFLAARIGDPLFAASWRSVLAVSAGLAAAGILSLAGIAFSTYFRTCYHTALYCWALKVQAARQGTGDGMAAPPEILSQVMGNQPKDGKEGSDATKT